MKWDGTKPGSSLLSYVSSCLVKACASLTLAEGTAALRCRWPIRGNASQLWTSPNWRLTSSRRRTIPRSTVFIATFSPLELPNSFDVAIAVDSVKHMTAVPMNALFSKIGHLLVPNGVFVLIEINTGSWRYRVKEVLNRVCPYNIDSHGGYIKALDQSRFEWVKSRGSHWMPFTFNSNSPMVKAFAFLEPLLMLDRWPSQSPWVMIASRKAPTVSAPPHQAVDFAAIHPSQDLILPSGYDVGPSPR